MTASKLCVALAASALAILSPSIGYADYSAAPSVLVPIMPPAGAVSPEFGIDYGQSWEVNEFASFSGTSVSPPGITFNIPAFAGAVVPLATNSGNPIQNGSGVTLTGIPNKISNYTSASFISIGRIGAIARQAFRAANGVPLTPTVHASFAYSSSTWGLSKTFGGGLGTGGGLQPTGGTAGSCPLDVSTPPYPGCPWRNMQIALNAVKTIFPLAQYGINFAPPSYKYVDYIQGPSTDGTDATKLLEIADMIVTFDGLGLPGNDAGGLQYYFVLPPGTSNHTDLDSSLWQTYNFARTNAPGAGGPYSGRVFLTGPMYQYPFRPNDFIHTGDYGTARTGEMLGRALYVTRDLHVPWTPLWRSLTAPIVASAATQTITIPFARPSDPAFSAAALSWETSTADGNGANTNFGFVTTKGGSTLAISSVSISGLNVVETIDPSTPITQGDSIVESYAMTGPIIGDTGAHAAQWGNLAMRGPTSALFPDRPLMQFALPFKETITVGP